MEFTPARGAFDIPDPWRVSILTETEDEPHLFAVPELDVESIKLPHAHATDCDASNALTLPNLETFRYGPIEGLKASEASTEPSESGGDALKDVEGILDWEDAYAPLPSEEIGRWFSWESFRKEGDSGGRFYISEQGPELFDAAIWAAERKQRRPQETRRVTKPNLTLRCLFNLGLGMSSSLFRFDPKKNTFHPLVDGFTLSGYSIVAFQSTTESIHECGRSVRRLKQFVERSYTSYTTFSAKVALANAVATILSAVETYIAGRYSQMQSLIRLQDTFSRPSQILAELLETVKSSRSARTDMELTSMLFKRCQKYEYESEWIRMILLEILTRVSRPYLDAIDRSVGFGSNSMGGWDVDLASISFLGPAPAYATDVQHPGVELAFFPEKLPAFVSEENGRSIFEIFQSLSFLRNHHPQHPLAHQSSKSPNRLSLEWKFTWHDLEHVIKTAKDYEGSWSRLGNESRTREIQASYQIGEQSSQAIEDFKQEDGADGLIRSTMAKFNRPITQTGFPDELYQLILNQLQAQNIREADAVPSLTPPLSLTPTLSFSPLLGAQARVVNAVCLRLFFNCHDIRRHLEVQRNFYLMGDGVFVSRLSSALFDPEVSTTERQSGVLRSATNLGLKLGDRGTWPPASSELRLALMGILTDCYHTGNYTAAPSPSHSTTEVPGGLSFAIRNLSEDEVQKVLDPDGLQALDFLRLQSSPPSPIDRILTPAAMEKYDAIFMFLFRLTRLNFVVSRLPRKSPDPVVRLLGLQCRHFVHACSRYFIESGVREPWESFMARVDDMEARARGGAGGAKAGHVGGIEELRRQHDMCLDRIRFALLLRNRQQKILGLLEDIFFLILHFASICRDGTETTSRSIEVMGVQGEFADKTRVFLDVCKGLVGKRGYGMGAADKHAKDNTMERLVIALDMNGFYSAPVLQGI